MVFKINQLVYSINRSQYELFDKNLMKGYLFNETTKVKLCDLSDVMFPGRQELINNINIAISNKEKILIKTDEPNKEEDFEKALTKGLESLNIDKLKK